MESASGVNLTLDQTLGKAGVRQEWSPLFSGALEDAGGSVAHREEFGMGRKLG